MRDGKAVDNNRMELSLFLDSVVEWVAFGELCVGWIKDTSILYFKWCNVFNKCSLAAKHYFQYKKALMHIQLFKVLFNEGIF